MNSHPSNLHKVPPSVASLACLESGGVDGFRVVRWTPRAVWIEGADIARVVRAVRQLSSCPGAYDPEFRPKVRSARAWADRMETALERAGGAS